MTFAADNRGDAEKKSAPLKQMPEAYRAGVQDFYGRDFLVSPAVLIPRPETEMMVDMVLNLAGKAYLLGVRAPEAKIPKNARILEVGTGSGCVATSLALELPDAKVVATDISEEALEVARENARRLGAKVEFLKSDLLTGVEEVEKFDVIVANLPYVDREWKWLDMDRLSFEPELALFAEDGGCELIFRLLEQIAKIDKNRGENDNYGTKMDDCYCGVYVPIEADPCQHKRIVEFAKERGFELEEERGFVLNLSKKQ